MKPGMSEDVVLHTVASLHDEDHPFAFFERS